MQVALALHHGTRRGSDLMCACGNPDRAEMTHTYAVCATTTMFNQQDINLITTQNEETP